MDNDSHERVIIADNKETNVRKERSNQRLLSYATNSRDASAAIYPPLVDIDDSLSGAAGDTNCDHVQHESCDCQLDCLNNESITTPQSLNEAFEESIQELGDAMMKGMSQLTSHFSFMRFTSSSSSTSPQDVYCGGDRQRRNQQDVNTEKHLSTRTTTAASSTSSLDDDDQKYTQHVYVQRASGPASGPASGLRRRVNVQGFESTTIPVKEGEEGQDCEETSGTPGFSKRNSKPNGIRDPVAELEDTDQFAMAAAVEADGEEEDDDIEAEGEDGEEENEETLGLSRTLDVLADGLSKMAATVFPFIDSFESEVLSDPKQKGPDHFLNTVHSNAIDREQCTDEHDVGYHDSGGDNDITSDVLNFAVDLSSKPQLFLLEAQRIGNSMTFPLLPLCASQEAHRNHIEQSEPKLVGLRRQLCPSHISEELFWTTYFRLLHNMLQGVEDDDSMWTGKNQVRFPVCESRLQSDFGREIDFETMQPSNNLGGLPIGCESPKGETERTLIKNVEPISDTHNLYGFDCNENVPPNPMKKMRSRTQKSDNSLASESNESDVSSTAGFSVIDADDLCTSSSSSYYRCSSSTDHDSTASRGSRKTRPCGSDLRRTSRRRYNKQERGSQSGNWVAIS